MCVFNLPAELATLSGFAGLKLGHPESWKVNNNFNFNDALNTVLLTVISTFDNQK